MPAITRRQAQEGRQQREREEIRDESLREPTTSVGGGAGASIAYVNTADAAETAARLAADAAHVAAADPHPQYLTVAEGAAAFDAIGAAAAAQSAAQTYADGKVIDSIADSDTTHAPSRNAVFDALATKQPTGDYVTFSDLAGFDAKPQVAYCSTSPLPANTYSNGASGVGATLTGNVNGPLLIDGVTLVIGAVGQRHLIAGEAAASHNGWFTLTQLGVLAVSPYILTRSTQSDQAAEIGPGYLTAVEAPSGLTAGSANNGKVFISISPSPFVVGTDSLTFAGVGSTYVADGTTLDLTLNVFGVKAGGIGTTQLAADGVTYAKMQNVSATSRILGRKSASAGDPEECTLSELLDFIGSAAQGDILYRGASAWARLAAGTSGYFLKTLGAGADPAWAAASGGSSYIAPVYWDYLSRGATSLLLTAGNRKVTASAAAWNLIRSNKLFITGKFYFEVMIDSAGAGDIIIGIGNTLGGSTTFLGNDLQSFGYYIAAGNKCNNGSITAYAGGSTTGDIVGVAVDPATGIYIAKNNTWLASGNPAAGTSPMFSITSTQAYFIAMSMYGAGAATLRAKAADQSYSPPSGGFACAES